MLLNFSTCSWCRTERNLLYCFVNTLIWFDDVIYTQWNFSLPWDHFTLNYMQGQPIFLVKNWIWQKLLEKNLVKIGGTSHLVMELPSSMGFQPKPRDVTILLWIRVWGNQIGQWQFNHLCAYQGWFVSCPQIASIGQIIQTPQSNVTIISEEEIDGRYTVLHIQGQMNKLSLILVFQDRHLEWLWLACEQAPEWDTRILGLG